MSIPTESYASIFDKYANALSWMGEIGVKFGTGRTSHYEKIVGYWKDSYKTATPEEAKEIFPDFVSSMFEIHDFVDVYRAFHNIPSYKLDLIANKLQKAVNGPINAADESPKSTAARNYLFEAVVAARGHRPDKGIYAILDAESDTGIKFKGKKLWIECKRVTVEDKIESNTRKASSQLETILKKQIGTGHKGIVAIDVSKIFNPGDKILVKNNDTELLNTIDGIMDSFIREKSNIWQRVYKRRNKKVIGTIIRFAFMSTSEERNILVHSSQWGMNPRLGISKSDHSLQKTLALTLSEKL